MQEKKPPQIVVPIGIGAHAPREIVHEIGRDRIVFIGVLREDHGLDLMIEALPSILRNVPNAKLRIIGSGTYEYNLKKRVHDSGLCGLACSVDSILFK